MTSTFTIAALSTTHLSARRSNAQEARAQNLAFWDSPAGGVQPVDIYLCDSRLSWQQLALWPGGNAVTYGSSIFISPLTIKDRSILCQLITHEMSHAFLNQRLGYLRGFLVPAWVNEGIATYVAQNFWATDDSLFQRLRDSATPQLIPATQLQSHTEWRAAIDGTPVEAALAYGHAQSLSATLIREFGPDRVKQYLDSTSLFVGADAAFQAAFGSSIADTDDRWLAEAKSAGKISQTTVWRDLHSSLRVAGLSLLPFMLFSLAVAWVFRQICLIGRSIAAHASGVQSD